MELVTWTNSLSVGSIFKDGFHTCYKRELEDNWPIAHMGDRVYIYGEVVDHPCNGAAKAYGERKGNPNNPNSFSVGLVIYPTEGITYSNGDSLLLGGKPQLYTDLPHVAWDWYKTKHPRAYIEFQMWRSDALVIYIYVEKWNVEKAISMGLNKYAPIAYMDTEFDENSIPIKVEKFIQRI